MPRAAFLATLLALAFFPFSLGAAPIEPVEITPEPLALKTGAPLSGRTLVQRPPFIKGLRSWTLETKRHRGYVVTIDVSPDGKQLATGGLDGIVRIWDLETGKFVRALVGHESYVYGLAWSPDGRTLASGGSFDATARLWDVATGRPLRVLKGHPGYVVHVAWSPDGRTLAVGGGTSGFVVFWDAVGGTQTRTVECGKHLTGLAWAPDGKTLAAAAVGAGVSLWDRLGKKAGTFKPEGGDALSVSWSSDGKQLLVGSGKNAVVWEPQSNKTAQTYPVAGIAAWSPDDKTLALGASGQAVQLWQPGADKATANLGTGAAALRWVPTGRIVCGTSAGASIWDTSPPKQVLNLDITAQAPLSWAPNRSALTGIGSVKLSLWDTSTCKRQRELASLPAGVTATAWSRDGRTLACGCGDGKVRLAEAATGKISELSGPKAAVASVAWSPDGRTLAAGTYDKMIYLWTVGTDKPPRVLEGHGSAVTMLAWSSAGLASGEVEGPVRLWDVSAGKTTRQLREQPAVLSLAWSPDAGRLAVGGNDDVARIYSATSGKLLHTFEQAGSPRGVIGLAYSPDGTILACGRDNHTMQLWKIKDEKQVHSIATMAPVHGTVWPTGSSTVACACADGAVRFWDSLPGRLRATLLYQNEALLAVSADGHFRAADTEAELVYVAQEENAQLTLSPREFTAKYGWKNSPTGVRLTGN